MQLQQFAQQNPHYEAPDQKPKSEQPQIVHAYNIYKSVIMPNDSNNNKKAE